MSITYNIYLSKYRVLYVLSSRVINCAANQWCATSRCRFRLGSLERESCHRQVARSLFIGWIEPLQTGPYADRFTPITDDNEDHVMMVTLPSFLLQSLGADVDGGGAATGK